MRHSGARIQARATPLPWWRWALWGACIVGTVLPVCFLAGLLSGPLFRVRTVEILASDAVAADVSRRLEQALPVQAHILATPVDYAVGPARSCPMVEDVRVSRRLPDTLVLELVERQPVAICESAGQALLVDAHGVVTGARGIAPKGLPVLKGRAWSVSAPGDQLAPDELAVVSACVCAAHEHQALSEAVIDLTVPDGIVCRLPDGVVGKLGGVEDLSRKLSLFLSLHRELTARGKRPAYIDVRVIERPVWRPRGV